MAKKDVLYGSNGGNVASATKKEDKKMNIEKAKKSWEGKGLTDGGLTIIGGWIDKIASAGKRYEAYQRLAFCSDDVRGSLFNLQNAIKMMEAGK